MTPDYKNMATQSCLRLIPTGWNGEYVLRTAFSEVHLTRGRIYYNKARAPTNEDVFVNRLYELVASTNKLSLEILFGLLDENNKNENSKLIYGCLVKLSEECPA